jgi:hypothetical protein
MKEEIGLEKEFHKNRLVQKPPQPPPAPPADLLEDANAWHSGLNNKLQSYLIGSLGLAVKNKEEEVKDQEERVKTWKTDVDDLIKIGQTLAEDLKKAGEQVEKLKADVQAAGERGSAAKKAILEADLAAAEGRLNLLKEHKTDLPKQIDETLAGWRKARQELQKLKAGGPGLESAQIEVKQVQEMQKFINDYKDELIREFIRQKQNPAPAA